MDISSGRGGGEKSRARGGEDRGGRTGVAGPGWAVSACACPALPGPTRQHEMPLPGDIGPKGRQNRMGTRGWGQEDSGKSAEERT